MKTQNPSDERYAHLLSQIMLGKADDYAAVARVSIADFF